MENDSRQSPAARSQGEARSGSRALWLLLAPVACCGGPLLIAAPAAAGALAWGALGLGIAAAAAAAVIVVARRRRRAQACCDPGSGALPRAARRSAARLRAR